MQRGGGHHAGECCAVEANQHQLRRALVPACPLQLRAPRARRQEHEGAAGDFLELGFLGGGGGGLAARQQQVACVGDEGEGRQDTELTVHHLGAIAADQVPEPEGAIARAGAEKLFLDGVQLQLSDFLAVSFENQHLCLAFQIVDDDCAVQAPTDEHRLLALARRARCAASYLAVHLRVQRLCTSPVHDPPDANLVVCCDGAYVAASRIEFCADYFLFVSLESHDTLSAFCVPKSQCLVI
mmetsp:Transcript_57716/g.135471  ORF Transcript_57716/g.135471 Transcript_57716/m.135471 type:complete len:240 (+) Transcript_57716:580-1299(+)